MRRLMFLFHRARCFGCQGCVAACAKVHDNPPELSFRTLLHLPPSDGRNDTVRLSMACNHCAEAPCVRACPSAALHRDELTGTVALAPERCLGCRYCQMACPFDAIRWDQRRAIARKCDFCAERLAANQEPACVATCFTQAIEFRWVEEGEDPPGSEREMPGFTHDPRVRPMIRFTSTPRPPEQEQP